MSDQWSDPSIKPLFAFSWVGVSSVERESRWNLMGFATIGSLTDYFIMSPRLVDLGLNTTVIDDSITGCSHIEFGRLLHSQHFYGTWLYLRIFFTFPSTHNSLKCKLVFHRIFVCFMRKKHSFVITISLVRVEIIVGMCTISTITLRAHWHFVGPMQNLIFRLFLDNGSFVTPAFSASFAPSCACGIASSFDLTIRNFEPPNYSSSANSTKSDAGRTSHVAQRIQDWFYNHHFSLK